MSINHIIVYIQTIRVSREEDDQAKTGGFATGAEYKQAEAEFVEQDNSEGNWSEYLNDEETQDV